MTKAIKSYIMDTDANEKGLTKVIKSYIMDTDVNEKIGQHFKVREFDLS